VNTHAYTADVQLTANIPMKSRLANNVVFQDRNQSQRRPIHPGPHIVRFLKGQAVRAEAKTGKFNQLGNSLHIGWP
jgi:hypothetical protein